MGLRVRKTTVDPMNAFPPHKTNLKDTLVESKLRHAEKKLGAVQSIQKSQRGPGLRCCRRDAQPWQKQTQQSSASTWRERWTIAPEQDAVQREASVWRGSGQQHGLAVCEKKS
eukprot:1338413-Amphidinium_carterae.1